MPTNVRTFLRDFAAFKARARKGETVRVQDKVGEFLFTAATARKSLLDAARGKITLHGDQFDRIIAASANIHRLPLITRDANITEAGVVETRW